MAGRSEERPMNQPNRPSTATPGAGATTATTGATRPEQFRSSTMSTPNASMGGNDSAGGAPSAKTQAQGMGRSFVDQARQQATDRLQDQKHRATDGITGVAQAVRQTGQSMRTGDQAMFAGYADQAADQLERLSSYLQQRDVSQLFGDVEDFARRRPAVFLGTAFGLGLLASRFLKSSGRAGQGGAGMGQPSVYKTIEVDVPVRTAYDQWTQFEEFPRFMEGVEEVRQLDDKRLHWKAQIAGKTEEWDAVITEQVPDRRIAWRSTTGARNDGVVSFYPIGSDRTRVQLRLDYQPQGPIESAGSALGLVDSRIEGDLKRFKEFIGARGAETGGWRGEIHGENVTRSPETGGGR